MLDYLLNGGQILCLCSDFINTVLPTYTTAEVTFNKVHPRHSNLTLTNILF